MCVIFVYFNSPNYETSYFSDIIIVAYYFSFFSCGSDSTSSIAEGNLAFSVVSSQESSPFQSLNYIPADVAKKMEATELSVWRKLSTCFYIDYSIVNTSYYKKNKKAFIRCIEKLYKEAKTKNGSPQRLLVAFSNFFSDEQLNLLEMEDTTGAGPDIETDSTYIEDIPLNDQAAITERILYNFSSHEVYLCVSADVKITGTLKNPVYDTSNAYFSGYAELTPAQQGANFDAKGRLSYRSMSTNVDEHYYILIIPKV